MTDLWRLSAAELLDGYQRRAFSPVEVTQCILDRIESKDKALHAYLLVDAEGALASARRAELAWTSPGGKPLLCGVPVHVKDTIDMAAFPTTYGSLAFKENLQPDAEIVKRLRASGAVIVGKTNTPEFALMARTVNRLGAPTVNPWALDRTAGGSSGGSASAVAAGLGALAIGTDSGGSVRLPAAYQGIFALKPSFQRIPAVQRWRASPARSHNGPITRTVRDTALMMTALAGPHPEDPDSKRHAEVDYMAFDRGHIRGARVALSRTFGRDEELDDAQASVLAEAALILHGLGCTIVEADPPAWDGKDELEPGVWAYSGDHFSAAEAIIPGFWEKHADELTDYARPIYEAGQRALAWQYRRILRRDRAYAEKMLEWFKEYDFLITPCCPAAPLNSSDPKADPRGTMGNLAPFNHAYNPAAAVPMGFDERGLPLAVQVVGRLGDDVGTLRVSALLEAAKPWAHLWPPFAEAR